MIHGTEEIPITVKLDENTYFCEAALWLLWRTRGEMRRFILLNIPGGIRERSYFAGQLRRPPFRGTILNRHFIFQPMIFRGKLRKTVSFRGSNFLEVEKLEIPRSVPRLVAVLWGFGSVDGSEILAFTS